MVEVKKIRLRYVSRKFFGPCLSFIIIIFGILSFAGMLLLLRNVSILYLFDFKQTFCALFFRACDTNHIK
ncbi:MAG: hypothetical protein K8S27_02785 [Candidatus Omnitrophica bacterium]|nr:hypothetical protein [Candidatus Omnitrophota bacterium]